MASRLQIIGGGNMGEALLRGLIADGWATVDDLHVVEPLTERCDYLSNAVPGLSCSNTGQTGVDAVLAVKPDVALEACSLLSELGILRVLSIAAGVRLEALELQLAPGTRVVRAMPNTPALIGQGAAAIAAGSAADPDDLDWAAGILSAVGTVVVVEEPLLDAVTGLSGSGPAYLFLLAEALIDAGCGAGLSRDIAVALTEQTLLGASTLLATSEEEPSTLRERVTSKGGTTAAGLAVFEAAGFREVVRDDVAAATERSRQLGAE